MPSSPATRRGEGIFFHFWIKAPHCGAIVPVRRADMKANARITRKVIATLAIAIASLALTTCDWFNVGLGDKVDVNPPVVEAQAPVVNSYVRGTFTLSGTANDDKGVTRVSVEYPHRGGGTVTRDAAYDAGTKVWTIDIPSGVDGADSVAEGLNVPFTVTVYDNTTPTPKDAKDVWTLNVDNTPPLALVTSPTSYGGINSPQQTSYIDIKGEAYDGSPVSLIHVVLYDTDGTTILGEKDADGTNTWSTRFLLKDPAEINLGPGDDGEVYTYDVFATDAAGNVSTYYYHRMDIYPIIPTGELFPTVNELGQLDQASAGTVSTPTGILYEDLTAQRLSNPAGFADFTFAYEALPDISFTNLDEEAVQDANVLGVNAPVTGIINPPPSAGAVDSTTFDVFIYDNAVDFAAKTGGEITHIEDTDPGSDSDNVVLQAVGSSLSFSIRMRDGITPLSPGRYWMDVFCGAQGTPVARQEVLFIIDSTAPILNETNIGSSTQSRNAAIPLSGNAISGTELLNGTVDIEQSFNDPSFASPTILPTVVLGAGTTVPWASANVPYGTSVNGVYFFRITLETPSGKTAVVERSLIYDTTDPSLAINSLNPSGTVNGVVQYSVGVSDANGINEVRWGVAATEPTWASLAANVVPAPYSGQFDTNAFSDGVTNFWILARDKAGNEGVTSQAITITQSTDNPTIDVTNMLEAGTAVQNLQGAGAKVVGTVTDDDMLNAASLQINVDGGGWTNITGYSDAKTINFEYTFSPAPSQGAHSYQLRVSDLASAKLGLSAVTTTLPAVAFAYDTADPSLTIADTSDAWQNTSFVLNGTAQDTYGLKAVQISYDNGGTWNAIAGATWTAPYPTTSQVWSYDLATHVPNLFDGSHEGPYDWQVRSIDAFDKTTALEFDFSVDTLIGNPVVTSPAAGSYGQSSAVTALGTTADAGSQINAVYWAVGASAPAWPGAGWNAATGTTTWNAALTGVVEGANTLWIRSTDVAGNASSAVSQAFNVDLSNPAVASPLLDATPIVAGTTYFRGTAGFQLSFQLSDNIDLQTVSITQTRASGPALTIPITSTSNPNLSGAADTGPIAFTVPTLPRNTSNLALQDIQTDPYVYELTVSDRSGRTLVFPQVNVTVDVTGPNVTLVTPAASSVTGAPTASLAVSGTSADVGSAGVASVEYRIDANGDGDFLDGGLEAWTAATGTTSFNATVNLDTDGWGADTGMSEGDKTIDVRSTDAAGNVSGVVSRAFTVDQGNPVLTETAVGTASTQYVNANLAFSGVGTDWNSLASFTVAISGVGIYPIAPDADGADNVLHTADDGPWTYLLDVDTDGAGAGDLTGLQDGTYVLTFTAVDVVGRSSSLVRTVMVDTTAPVLDITSPLPSESLSSTPATFTGTSKDTGGAGYDGTADVEYNLNGAGWNSVTLQANGTWSAASVALGTEGSKTLQARSADRVGNQSSASVNFYYDLSAPSLAETTIGTTTPQLTWLDVTLAGTASDTNALTGVAITATKDGVSQGTVYSTASSPWTYTMATGSHANDGLWVFTITATDAASKTTQLTRTVRVDTLAPVPTISTPTAGSFATGTVYQASGGASDANVIASVEYSINGANWFTAAGTTTWTQNLSLTGVQAPTVPTLGEGDQTLYVRATDQAGNASTAVTRAFRVDLNNPGVTETAIGSGSVFKNATFSLSGVLSDNVDLAAVTVTQNRDGLGASTVYSNTYAGLNDTSSAWSVPGLPSGGLTAGVYEFIVTVTDASGKTSSLTRTVTVDSTVPSVSITSVLPILSGNVVNGRITLGASASDANGLTGVKYFVRAAAGVPAYGDGDGTVITAPYSAQINTTVLTDGVPYYLYVVARDKAGNDASATATVNVNQSSDDPTPSITSPIPNGAISADRYVRGTFTDDDGVVSGGAVLHVKKSTSGTYTDFPIALTGSAGQLVAWAVDVSSVLSIGGDGTYNTYLTVADDASAKSGLGSVSVDSSVQNFSYDNSPPTVSATITKTPDSTAYKSGDAITLSWTASDASGLGSQTMDIDSDMSSGLGSVVDDGGGNFHAVLTVPGGAASGNKTFTINVTDTTGRTTTRTASIFVDMDAPTVENAITIYNDASSPAAPFVGALPNGAFTIKGTAFDSRGLQSVQIRLTGTDGSLGWTTVTLVDGNWSYAIASSALYETTTGNLVIDVRSYDQAGNVSGTRTFNQTIDQSADLAVASVISPVNASTYGTTVQLSGTAADDDFLKDSPVNGTIDADAVEVVYWGTAPVVAPVTINPTIVGTGKNATWNHTLSGLTGGVYSMHARARDNTGWGAWTSDVSFTVNAGAPNLTVSTAFDAFRNNAVFPISGTVADSDGIQYVQVRVNGGGWQTATAGTGSWGVSNTSDTWSITLNLGSDGLKTVEIQAADMSSFVANAQRSTTLDATPPSGAFDSTFKDNPTGSALALTALNKVVRVTGTVTELNLRDTDPVEIRIDGGSWTPVTGTFVWSYVWDTSLISGAHVLDLRVTDKAGNFVDTVTQNVTVNQAADNPSITQAFVAAPDSASAGNNVLGALLKVSGTLSDDDGFNAGAVNIILDGAVGSPIGATNTAGTTAAWEYTWGSLAQGEHFLSIQATDRNGNMQSLGPTYFIVDNANPTLAITMPTPGAKVMAGTLVISGTASDSGGLGATPVSITLRHSNVLSPLHNTSYSIAAPGGIWSQNVSINGASLDGTLYIDVLLTDRAGKTTSITRAATIDTTAPSLSLTYPPHASYVNGLISFTGTADDLNGLADVTLEILDPATRTVPRASIARTGSTLAAWEFPFNSFGYTTSTYAHDVNGDGKLWQIWYRLAATDNSGNVQYYQVSGDWPYLFVDTDGDKPTISVTQPKNGDIIGGFVTMLGSASDDDGPVMRVEVQIDFNGDGDFTDTRDINNNDSDSNPATGIDLGIPTDDGFGHIVRIGDAAHKWEDEAAWYVVSVTNGTWTLELNSNGELYKGNTGGVTGNIIIRTRSRDQFGLASEISSRTITLDETYPRIENVSPNDQTYQSGVFHILADFGDNVDLNLGLNSQIRMNINKAGYQTLTVGGYVPVTHPYALTSALGAPQYGYDLDYTLDTADYFPGSSGILYVDLYVRDESLYTNLKSMTFYVDNQAPTSTWSTSITHPDGSNLRNGMITVNSVNKTYVEGNYGDSGTVAGISHIEMYLANPGTSVIRNIKASGIWSGTPATESINTETYDLVNNIWTPGTSATAPYVKHDEMISVNAGSFTIGNKYVIRTVGTTDYTLIGAASSAVGVSFTATGAGSGTGTAYDKTAADGYVIKVDNASEMSDLTIGTDVDGDGYHEYMGIYDGAARWRAYFNSQYLPDGVMDLHYVVYDLAGNYTHRMRQVFIANNGPQLDQVQIGSDLNANGTVANGANLAEITDYYNPALSVDRTDSQKIKNLRLYLGVNASDNNQVRQIFMDVYNAAGTTYLGNAYTSAINPASGDIATTLTVTPGTAPWTGAYSGGKIDYYLKVIVRDDSLINISHWVKVSVMDPTDSTAPNISLNPLAQADQDKAIGHLELQGDNTVGDWNTIIAAYGGDNDAKASGKIVYKGTITDENRVSAISVASQNNPDTSLAVWTGGFLVADATGFTITSQNLGENGHTVNFRYEWDSSYVTGVAGLNRTISFGGQDGAANPATAANSQVDVVPYVSGITTQLSSAYSSVPTTLARSAQGYYPVRSGEQITVNGFNFNGASTVMAVNGVPQTVATTGTPLVSVLTTVGANYAVTANSGTDAFTTALVHGMDANTKVVFAATTMPTGLTAGTTYYVVGGTIGANTFQVSATSGGAAVNFSTNGTAVTVSTMSGDLVALVNGVRSVNNINSNSLTSNQEPNSTNNNILTDDRKVNVWLFNNVVSATNIRFPSMRVGTDAGQTVGFVYDSGAQYVRMNVAGSDFQVDQSYTQWYDTAVAVDSNGYPYGFSMNGDSGGSGTQDGPGAAGGHANGEFYAWNTAAAPGSNNTGNTAAYTNGTKKVAIENSYTTSPTTAFDSTRILNPKIATYATSATAVNVYMSYYDNINSETRYRYGTVTGTYPTPAFGGNLLNHNNVASGSGAGYHVIADGTTTFRSGKFSAVGVSPTGARAYAAWYDANARRLVFSYNTSPATASGAQWQTNATYIDGAFTGWYVDMAVDAADHIHLAYYNSSTGDLKYAYLDTYTSTPVVVTVDSWLSVGTNLSITTVYNGTNYVPYISYYMSSYDQTQNSLRLAYRTDFSVANTPTAGVIGDLFTGNWEVQSLPTSNIPLNFRVGVGIKNVAGGRLNGPIVGYATDVNLETAQLK